MLREVSMGLPRSRYVQEGQEGVYHCFSRCVRRAFLCGVDAVTGRDFTHRKAWLVERLRHLATIFAVEVCAYAVMDNHYHTVLRTRPDVVNGWSDSEVARRWLTLFPRHRDPEGYAVSATENEIRALVDCPNRVATLRQRLSSLSWFMGRLNEFLARAANKEDQVKGRFWESRFKCQALLDEAAIAACMVYVDLNQIRAGEAECPEDSDFTSIRERIRAWQREALTAAQNIRSGPVAMDVNMSDDAAQIPTAVTAAGNPTYGEASSASWLCPIESDFRRRGILPMTAAEYFDLVDRSGRMTRTDKRGVIDAGLAPILGRIGANPEAWPDTISEFGSRFCLAAGLLSSLRDFADRVGQRWMKGLASARAAFSPAAPHCA
jgi:REP element-mobilizing transposase RayT